MERTNRTQYCQRRKSRRRTGPDANPPGASLSQRGRRRRCQGNGGRGESERSASKGFSPCYDAASYLVPGAIWAPPGEILRYFTRVGNSSSVCEHADAGETTLGQVCFSAQEEGSASLPVGAMRTKRNLQFRSMLGRRGVAPRRCYVSDATGHRNTRMFAALRRNVERVALGTSVGPVLGKLAWGAVERDGPEVRRGVAQKPGRREGLDLYESVPPAAYEAKVRLLSIKECRWGQCSYKSDRRKADSSQTMGEPPFRLRPRFSDPLPRVLVPGTYRRERERERELAISSRVAHSQAALALPFRRRSPTRRCGCCRGTPAARGRCGSAAWC